MAAEWVGITLTAIATTALNFGFNLWAEQRRLAHERAVREGDRAWELRRYDVSGRRELYAKLLREVDAYDTILQEMVREGPEGMSDDYFDEQVRAATQRFDHLVELKYEIEVSALDPELPEFIGRLIYQQTWVRVAQEAGDASSVVEAMEDSLKVLGKVSAAVRADLDLPTR